MTFLSNIIYLFDSQSTPKTPFINVDSVILHAFCHLLIFFKINLFSKYLLTWFLITVRQEVKRIDNSVVAHELELAIICDL